MLFFGSFFFWGKVGLATLLLFLYGTGEVGGNVLGIYAK